VLVDAKDDQACQFYERYGFLRFKHQEYKPFITMKTVEESFHD